MARGRSKSIVQKIASDVPTYKEDRLNLGAILEETPTQYRGTRSKSLTNVIQVLRDDNKLYPFSDKEANELWSNYLERFNFDCLLAEEDIKRINDYQIDSLLNFHSICKLNQKEIGNMIEETSEIETNVGKLMVLYQQISSETSDFDQESSKLLEIQMEYQTKLDQINGYLHHFEKLDMITKNLSRGGYNLIKRRLDFFKNEILINLDNSLEFVESNPNLKDVNVYKSRFRQCMTRSLTLIKNFMNEELKLLGEKLTKSIKNNENKNIDLLIYNEFNNYLKNNDHFGEWIIELIKRIPNHLEYKGLLSDVMSNYFAVRLQFINLYLSTISLNESNENKSPVQVSQDHISFYKRLIEKEMGLFNNFFILNSSVSSIINHELYEFFKRILDPLYDSSRHIILKETNITNLCQLSILLQKYYEFDEEEINIQNEINYGELFQPILDDVQSRLIFRIQIYVDETLMKYKPKAEDLKIGNRKSSGVEPHRNVLDIDYQANLFPEVYLPLGKALTLLSEIYELINHIVFDHLAHYIVHSCIELLRGGFYKLSVTHLGIIDAKLHYLKNLMILKMQLNNYDIKFVQNNYTFDFTTGLNDAWRAITSGQFSLNHTGFIDIVKKSAPRIINSMIDANDEIEFELHNAVHDFIKECTNLISEPIVFDTPQKKKLIIENSDEVYSNFKHNLITKIPHFHKQITLFIDDPTIVQYLMNNLANLIVVIYENFYRFCQENWQTDKPKTDFMEVDTLFAFVNDIIADLYDQDEQTSKDFDQDILKDLQIEDPKDSSA
jgi:hypothetical protein